MGWHHIKQALSVLSIVIITGVSAAAIYSLAHGTKFLSVQSGSMVPTFRKGDLVIDTRVSARQIAIGDVVTYTNPAFMDGQPITHRVVDIPSQKNGYRFTTKGDANKIADPQFGSRGIIGKVSHSVPYIGFVFDFVRKPIGLALLIYLPALAVIIAEIRRLMKYYKDMEPYVATSAHMQKNDTPKTANKARFIPHATAAALIAAILIAVPTVQAALMSSATLTGTTLSTAPIGANHVVIYQVAFGGSTSGTNSVSTTNNVNVTTNNAQSATSGNATASNGGNATSGNASNTSNTNVTITVNNSSLNTSGSSGGTTNNQGAQTVTLYNPTNQAVSLANWQLSDNSTTHTITTGSIAAKGYFVYTWPISGGLQRIGDHIAVRDASAAGVDSLSWGTDTTQLNPSVATTTATTTITRKSLTLDTNTARDWQPAP